VSKGSVWRIPHEAESEALRIVRAPSSPPPKSRRAARGHVSMGGIAPGRPVRNAGWTRFSAVARLPAIGEPFLHFDARISCVGAQRCTTHDRQYPRSSAVRIEIGAMRHRGVIVIEFTHASSARRRCGDSGGAVRKRVLSTLGHGARTLSCAPCKRSRGTWREFCYILDWAGPADRASDRRSTASTHSESAVRPDVLRRNRAVDLRVLQALGRRARRRTEDC
jgi:hypothetical protein